MLVGGLHRVLRAFRTASQADRHRSTPLSALYHKLLKPHQDRPHVLTRRKAHDARRRLPTVRMSDRPPAAKARGSIAPSGRWNGK